MTLQTAKRPEASRLRRRGGPAVRWAALGLLLCSLLLFSLAIAAPVASADVLTTSEGLVLEGKVTKLESGWYRVTTEAGTVELAPSAVASVTHGVSPRADLKAEAAKAKDAVDFFRLALKADAAGLRDLHRTFLQAVLKKESDHPAARRALGYERHEGTWVAADDARRKKGLVLYRGRWMLPAEVEGAAGAKTKLPAATEVDPAKALIRTSATAEDALRLAARLAIARTDDAVLLQAALSTLYDKDPKVRIASAQLLGRLGDEAALRALIFSGARDASAAVRREAVLAAQAFGHDDTAIPFTRALGSKNLRLAANAAEALGLLGDQRVAPYIIKRMRSHGSSTRNVVSFINQVSYVRDYDVEIAQASNIANPDIGIIQEGVVLDVQVKDASWTKTWIEPYLVKAWNQVMGQKHRSAAEAQRWYIENKDTLPRFPEKPGRRAPPRRRKGRAVGAPVH